MAHVLDNKNFGNLWGEKYLCVCVCVCIYIYIYLYMGLTDPEPVVCCDF